MELSLFHFHLLKNRPYNSVLLMLFLLSRKAAKARVEETFEDSMRDGARLARCARANKAQRTYDLSRLSDGGDWCALIRA
jgi:hypothetical protein